jgi:plastocyanin
MSGRCLAIVLGATAVVMVALSSGCIEIAENETDGNRRGDPYVFDKPKKSPHYEGNTPAHGDILAGPPINVVIDFNFDLGPGSKIRITNNNDEYGIGATNIDSNKLAMRREMVGSAPNGVYRVDYTACWPDGSCHEGYFEFAINRSKASESVDRRGESRVEIAMRNIAFVPAMIHVDKGTEVVWTNEDTLIHYVNTDSHPYHTYFPDQNSEAMKEGDTFSLVFDEPGIYPYHCSAHTDMKGQILVE